MPTRAVFDLIFCFSASNVPILFSAVCIPSPKATLNFFVPAFYHDNQFQLAERMSQSSLVRIVSRHQRLRLRSRAPQVLPRQSRIQLFHQHWVHAEILQSLARCLGAAWWLPALRQDVLYNFAEQFDLALVHQLAQLGNITGARNIHRARHQDVASIDSGVDQMDGTTDRIAVPGRPFGDIHATIAGQNAHVRIEQAQRRGADDVLAHDTRAGVNAEINLLVVEQLHGVGRVQRIDFDGLEAVLPAEVDYRPSRWQTVTGYATCRTRRV